MSEPLAAAAASAQDDRFLVGRDEVRRIVDALLDGARAGRSAALVLRGEAGIGKSALLEYAAARADGMRVLGAVCVEAEAELPFSALHQLLRPLVSNVPALADVHRHALEGALGLSGERVDDRFLIGAGTLSLLAYAAESEPILCLVDDAHWLDRASRDALYFAARRLEAEGVALLVAERAGAAPGARADLPTLSVGTLDAAEARALLERRYGNRLSATVRDRLVSSAAGNPLALVEFASALTDAQRLALEPLPEPLLLPDRLESLYGEHLGALDAAARTFLVVAAAEATGDHAIVLAAAEALGITATAFEAPEKAGLVRAGGGRIAFRHPLVRAAVYGNASFAERQRVHVALAAALARPADADRRAWHLAAAAAGVDEEVGDLLEASADRARRRGGFASVSSAMERAARLTARDDIRARRLAAAADGAVRAGDNERALALLAEFRVDDADPLVRSLANATRGMVELRAGVPAEAVAPFFAAAEEATSFDPHLAVTLAMRAAEAASVGGELERVGDLLEWVAAFGELERVEDRLILHLLEGLVAFYRGDAAAGVPALTLALSEADELTDAAALHWAATAANYVGQWQRAEALYRAAVDRARATGDVHALPFSLVHLAAVEYRRGALATAEADAAEGLWLARETGQEPIRAFALALLAHTAAVRGVEDECTAFAAEALELALPRRLRGVATSARYALAELDLSVGRSLRALERLEALLADPDTHPAYRVFGVPGLVEAGARAGWADRVRESFSAYEEWARAAEARSEAAVIERCRALLADDEASEAHFEEALRLHAESPQPFERARTQLAYGEFLRRARRKSEARVQLRAAVEAFAALGATRWAERARAELRATGETVRKRVDGFERGELTPQELQVARLVARGATNRDVAAQLFVSPKTVEYHLHKVFMKLNVSSRIELARLELDGDDATAATARVTESA